jgi:hypothetical protein
LVQNQKKSSQNTVLTGLGGKDPVLLEEQEISEKSTTMLKLSHNLLTNRSACCITENFNF